MTEPARDDADFAFYDAIAPFDDFAEVGDPARYHPAPDDWVTMTADVVHSTQAVAEGRYKQVNMAGAAVIAAATNALGRRSFPFAFGGDGATLAAPPGRRAALTAALAAVRVWAREELALDLRVAAFEVAAIRAAGHELSIARHRPSPHVSFAMFAGGGARWATDEMKAGRGLLAEADAGARADLAGLSCRWAPMKARHGLILSLIVDQGRGAADDAAFAALTREVLAILAREDRSENPAAGKGLRATLSRAALRLEAGAARGAGGAAAALKPIRREALIGWLLFQTGFSAGGLDPARYRRVLAQNSDFRKFDDGLRLTADCSRQAADRIEALLEAAEARGLCVFGMHRQDHAIMTCLVPDYRTDDHVHFIDGAAGGYTEAAARMRRK